MVVDNEKPFDFLLSDFTAAPKSKKALGDAHALGLSFYSFVLPVALHISAQKERLCLNRKA